MSEALKSGRSFCLQLGDTLLSFYLIERAGLVHFLSPGAHSRKNRTTGGQRQQWWAQNSDNYAKTHTCSNAVF